MQFTAQQIGILLDGSVDGNPEDTVNQLAKIEDAQSGSLSFLANPKYEQFIYQTNASIVIVNKEFVASAPIKPTLIRVENAYTAFSLLLQQYNSIKLNKKGIEEPCYIHPSARIGKDVYIGAFAYIGADVVLGDNSKIYPQVYLGDNSSVGSGCTLFSGVKIYHDCKIGSNVIIHSGSVIGSDGFGFAPLEDGSYSKISQIGNVIIEDDVEIGSNTSIDRATMGSTIIKKGVKLDNLIQIAHNVEIGSNTVIASQAGVSGSTKIGAQAIVGGQVGIVGHINVAKGSQIQAQSGINRAIVEEDKKWAGSPATSFNNQMRAQVIFNRLPEMQRKIDELERKLKEFTK